MTSKYTVHGRRRPAADNGILHPLGTEHRTEQEANRSADEYKAKGWMDVEVHKSDPHSGDTVDRCPDTE